MIRGKFLYHGENEQNNSFRGLFLIDRSLLEHFRLHSVRYGYSVDERAERSLPYLEMENLDFIVLRAHIIH